LNLHSLQKTNRAAHAINGESASVRNFSGFRRQLISGRMGVFEESSLSG
jgi:hypothetical protein